MVSIGIFFITTYVCTYFNTIHTYIIQNFGKKNSIPVFQVFNKYSEVGCYRDFSGFFCYSSVNIHHRESNKASNKTWGPWQKNDTLIFENRPSVGWNRDVLGFFFIAPLIFITESQIRHQIKLELTGFKTKKITSFLPIGRELGGGSKRQMKKKNRLCLGWNRDVDFEVK